ncbi:magnesium/cobalt transporter CorA [Haloplanus rallus]|jgi:magnesium transporter|uniref:Magnesium transport protein CorA n=1 Tax=Haloplanus rallus TaxID=1816183 RepID=A0A6B9FGY7_9EURY|nr:MULTISPECIES: magnesium/cobalt transporter CorA [Haloplanus]QGX96569.1 magnesium/cobalt transporter CorA [Haloplanus rallus]
MTVRTVVYDRSVVEGREGSGLDALREARSATGTTWVRVSAPTDEELDRVAEAFDLHALEIEDVQGTPAPKVEEFPEHTFVLVKSARLRGGETTFEEEIRDQPVGLFFGHDWIVTITAEETAAVGSVWERVAREEPRLLGNDADFTAYRVLDAIVDEYFAILDEIGRDIEAVEDRIIDDPDTETLEILNSLRRELLSIRRIVWPTRDAVSVLARGDAAHVRSGTEKYYRDVYDHLVQHVELVETYRDLASGARDIYLNTLSQSTNEVMKRLTVVATIILPLTFVVGVYGMNFSGGPYNMPELGWRFGYPAVVAGMALTAAVMLGYFRSSGWL